MTTRIRYLKPDFFLDEDVANLPPLTRLFYAGLWCHADREGRLQDRPERLRVEIMPYEKDFDVEEALVKLAQPKRVSGRPYILRYQIDSRRFIQIISWRDHQKPHHTEVKSLIPPPPEEELNRYLTVKSPLENGSITGGNGDGDGDGEENGDGEGEGDGLPPIPKNLEFKVQDALKEKRHQIRETERLLRDPHKMQMKGLNKNDLEEKLKKMKGQFRDLLKDYE